MSSFAEAEEQKRTITSTGQYEYVIPPFEDWTDFDYAMRYAQLNPSCGVVLISPDPHFRRYSNYYFANFNVDKYNVLHIHDDTKSLNIRIVPSSNNPDQFYYFYLDGQRPTRHIGYKQSNLNVLWDRIESGAYVEDGNW